MSLLHPPQLSVPVALHMTHRTAGSGVLIVVTMAAVE